MQTTLVSCEEDLTLCLVFGLEIVTTTMSSGPRIFCNAAFHHITAHLLLCLYHSVVLVVSHIWLAASGHRDKVISHCTILLKFIDNCLDFQLTNK